MGCVHSRLSTSWPRSLGEVDDAGLVGALMAARFRSSVSSSRRLRSSDRPLGSPIIPVAPPASAIREVPGVLEATQHDQADQVAVVEAVGRKGRSRSTG